MAKVEDWYTDPDWYDQHPGNTGGGGNYVVPDAPAPPPTPTAAEAPPPPSAPGAPPPPGAPPTYPGPMRPDTSWLSAAPGFVAPMFTPPPAFHYDAFKAPDPFAAPSFDDVQKDPGYIGRRDEGLGAVRMGAASLGKLRTGGTIKDLINFNQNFASREYGNVFDRSLGTYKTNYDNQWNQYLGGYNTAADVYRTNYGVSRDVFDRTYAGAKDMFAPQLLSWQSQQQAMQRAADQEFERQFEAYKYGTPSADTVFGAGVPR